VTVFDHEDRETVSIKALKTVEDLDALLAKIKACPEIFEEIVGRSPIGIDPGVIKRTDQWRGYEFPAIIAEFGSYGFHVVVRLDDTVITYADGTFDILPTSYRVYYEGALV
jgi:hypothetical protein